MSPIIQTRCPHCFSYFDLPAAQVDQAQAKGRCGQCQQVFLVNDYLIVSAEKDSPLAKNNVLVEGDVTSHYNADINTKAANKAVTKASVSLDKQYSVIEQGDIETALDYSDYNFKDDAYKVASYPNVSSKSAPLFTSVNKQSLDNKKTTSQDVIDHFITDKPLAAEYDESDVWQSLLDQAIATTDNAKPHKSTAHETNDSANVTASLSDTSSAQANNSELNSINYNSRPASQSPIQIDAAPHLTHLLTNKNQSSDTQHSHTKSNSKVRADAPQSVTHSQTPVASLLWLAGCLVLILLLFAQYIIFNLNTLIKNPTHAAQLQTVCSIVICSLPNADLSKLTITELSYSSSHVNNNANFSDIKANLVNTDSQAQLLPSLRVSVYNTNSLLGVFIATPDNYLLSTQSQLTGNAYKSVMFTVPLAVQQIDQVKIDTLY